MLSIGVRNKDHHYVVSLTIDQSYYVLEWESCIFTSGRMDSNKFAVELVSMIGGEFMQNTLPHHIIQFQTDKKLKYWKGCKAQFCTSQRGFGSEVKLFRSISKSNFK